MFQAKRFQANRFAFQSDWAGGEVALIRHYVPPGVGLVPIVTAPSPLWLRSKKRDRDITPEI